MSHDIRAVVWAKTKKEALEKFWAEREGHELRIVRILTKRNRRAGDKSTFEVFYRRKEADP